MSSLAVPAVVVMLSRVGVAQNHILLSNLNLDLMTFAYDLDPYYINM